MPGTLTITTLSDGTNSTSATNPIRGSAKAWVNFDGTGTIGVNATVRTSYNVSSVLKNATGDFTISFTNAMADANYVVVGGTQFDTASAGASVWFAGVRATNGVPVSKTTTAVRVNTAAGNLAAYNGSESTFMVFGN